MRIFYASDNTPNAALQSNLWRHNLYEPLVDLGHEVLEFDYDLRETFRHLDKENPQHRRFIVRNRRLVSAELLRQVEAAHHTQPLDLFFSYFYDACVTPATLDAIRALGVTTVNWYCNGSYQLHLVSEIAPHYDWCLVPEKFRLPDYVAMGARPLYCQEAANPHVYHPYDVPIEYDVTFVGQAYGDRPAHISFLLEHDVDVHVWGDGWREKYSSEPRSVRETLRRAGRVSTYLMTPQGRQLAARRLGLQRAGAGPHTEGQVAATNGSGSRRITAPHQPRPVLPATALGGPLPDEEMVRMFSRSKINLGFSSCGETHETTARVLQVRLRDFEVPMSGGFYMVEYMEELEEFFDIGREIVCYTGPEDLVDKIRYYLEHDAEREAIRAAGRARCLRDHTWHKRFETALTQMGLNQAHRGAV